MKKAKITNKQQQQQQNGKQVALMLIKCHQLKEILQYFRSFFCPRVLGRETFRREREIKKRENYGKSANDAVMLCAADALFEGRGLI